MELSALAGNRRLKASLARRELSHAYILSGPAGSGRHTLARLLCQAMLCTAPAERRPCGGCGACRKVQSGIHPDVVVISGGEKPITVDQVRALRTDAYIRPNEGSRKIYLLEQADRMNQSAQNAMLKLLEDGPSYGAFLLLAENGGGLLQTVRSRCEELMLTPVPPSETERWLEQQFPQVDATRRHQAALECQGLLGRAVERLQRGQEGEEQRQQARTLAQALAEGDELTLLEAVMPLEKLGREELCLLMEQAEAELVSRLPAASSKKRILQAVRLLKKLEQAAQLNANPGQLMGWLCAGLFGGQG